MVRALLSTDLNPINQHILNDRLVLVRIDSSRVGQLPELSQWCRYIETPVPWLSQPPLHFPPARFPTLQIPLFSWTHATIDWDSLCCTAPAFASLHLRSKWPNFQQSLRLSRPVLILPVASLVHTHVSSDASNIPSPSPPTFYQHFLTTLSPLLPF